MLKQKKLVSAIAIAVGASTAALGAAQAGTILFPQIAVGPTITTVVSVMNAGEGYEVNGETLHYRYYWKEWLDKSDNADNPDTAAKENVCIERNRYLPVSKNDLQTMDIGDIAFGSAGRGVMFLDESVNNKWDKNPVDYSLGANLPGSPASHRAYLVVDNDSSASWGPDLAGEAIVFEVENGASWGYQAFQNQYSDDFDFLDYASARYSLVAYMPPDEVTTRFLVTALDRDMAPGSTYTESAYIGVRVLDPFDGATPGVYDRDENFFSGGIDRKVTCVGAWDIEDLYPDASSTTPGGGWTNITNYGTYGKGDKKSEDHNYEAAAVFKIEYGTVVDGVDVGGVFNNGLYLHPDMKYLKTEVQ
jgi:hypothetical protein